MIRASVLIALGIVLIAALAGSAATAATPASGSLTGLWAVELHLGSEVRGELRVARAAGGLRAAIAGTSVRCEQRGDSVQFRLPGDRGRFRGAWSADHRALAGFWIQPAGGSVPYASPLALRASGPNVWRGTVTPLENRFTLYLSVFQGPDDSLLAAFRNPESNSVGGTMRFHVRRDGDSLVFYARPDTTRPQIRLAGAIAGQPPRVRVRWPDLDRVLELTRPGARLAAAYRPRAQDPAAYRYHAPAAAADGWATARASAVGMDEDSLAGVIRQIIAVDPGGARPALVHSLLVARRGRLVLEEYFFGFDRERVHDTRSAAKTFASVMLGVAMREGAPIGPGTPACSLLAARGPFQHPDPRKSNITLAHLMTHTSGLACDDNDDESPGNEDVMQKQSAEPEWWKYTLDLPMAYEPGTHYAYCSGGMNVVGAALAAATGRWLPELFDRAIARPLSFGPWFWNLTPTLDGYTGGGAYLRPRDLLKLGQAYLDGGVWRGNRIVDSSWVRRSTSPEFDTGEGTADGYAWHLHTLDSGARRYREYEANGNGGQFLIVVPELDLAVVFTAGNYRQYGIWRHFRDDIVAREIIPAIRDR